MGVCVSVEKYHEKKVEIKRLKLELNAEKQKRELEMAQWRAYQNEARIHAAGAQGAMWAPAPLPRVNIYEV
jgi:hypothetical protein